MLTPGDATHESWFLDGATFGFSEIVALLVPAEDLPEEVYEELTPFLELMGSKGQLFPSEQVRFHQPQDGAVELVSGDASDGATPALRCSIPVSGGVEAPHLLLVAHTDIFYAHYLAHTRAKPTIPDRFLRGLNIAVIERVIRDPAIADSGTEG